MKKKVLVLGASGLLGSSLCKKFKLLNYELITHSFQNETDYKVELSNKASCDALLKKVNPNIIVNLVALTDVDLCEDFPNEAYKLNVEIVRNITDHIINYNKGIHLIQISTDHVYDGGLYPHKEDQTLIKNIYAFSKLMSEIIAERVSSTIIRTNFIGKSQTLKKNSLTDWVYNNLTKDKKINAFDDIFFNPVSMETLCSIIIQFVDSEKIGLYNVGSKGNLTKADFIIKFAKKLKLPINNIIKTSVKNILLNKAYRPKNMIMDCNKFENEMKTNMPTIDDEIHLCAEEYL